VAFLDTTVDIELEKICAEEKPNRRQSDQSFPLEGMYPTAFDI
jgi:hypothetical protein